MGVANLQQLSLYLVQTDANIPTTHFTYIFFPAEATWALAGCQILLLQVVAMQGDSA